MINTITNLPTPVQTVRDLSQQRSWLEQRTWQTFTRSFALVQNSEIILIKIYFIALIVALRTSY